MSPIDIPDQRETVFRAARDFRKIDPRAQGLSYRGFSGKIGSLIDEARKNADFVWARKSASQSRYSDGKYPVLYTAKHRSTCYPEVAYHVQELVHPVLPPGSVREIPHILYRVRIKGKLRNYMPLSAEIPLLCRAAPAGYGYCNEIAKAARADGVDYLMVPSARALGKPCIPVLSRFSAANPSAAWAFVLEITDSKDFIRVYRSGRRRQYRVDRVY